jgi:polyhydroxyalkanoate synthesis regulator phasin
LQSIVPRFVAAKSQSRNFKRNISHIISEKVVRTIPSEMDTIRKRLGELEERISKIDKLDKLEARVRSLEEKLQKKR